MCALRVYCREQGAEGFLKASPVFEKHMRLRENPAGFRKNHAAFGKPGRFLENPAALCDSRIRRAIPSPGDRRGGFGVMPVIGAC